MAEGIQFNVDAALAKLGELVSEHGPQAVDLAAEVVRVDAIGNLVRGSAFLVVTVACSAALPRLYRAVQRNDSEPLAIATVSVGMVLPAALIAAAIPLLNPWYWVALFNPKLALAHQVLERVAGF